MSSGNRWLGLSAAVALSMVVLAQSAQAAPSVMSVSSTSSDKVSHGDTLSISGAGFGEKGQAAPVLVDYITHAYENGMMNNHNKGFNDMQAVHGADVEPGSPWADTSSNSGQVVGDVHLATSRSKRHAYSEGSYYFRGPNHFVGRPVAYGGSDGWDTPVDNSQLYVAWWYKPKYNPLRYWRISAIDQKGTFIKDEPVSIGTSLTGVYAGFSEDNWHNIVINEPSSWNEPKGKLVTGLESGATMVFPTTFAGAGSDGYLTPGNKFLRVWEHRKSEEGFTFIWADNDAFVVNRQGGKKYASHNALSLEGNKWHLLEFMLDTDKGTVDLWHNTKRLSSIKFDPAEAKKGALSPTLALLGINAKIGHLQESDISEIFMDKTLQRVVVGNAPSFEEVTHYELQRPVGWLPDKIDFVLNVGELSKDEQGYVYVFDKDGNVNSKGYPLCYHCISPPQSIQLQVN